MRSSAPIRFRRIGEVFPEPHAIESIAKFDSSNKCELLRKLEKVGFDIFPFIINQYGDVRSCGSTLFLVSASGSRFPSTSGVISAFVMWFTARAAISPTFPWWSIFAFVSSAHLNFKKLVIPFAMEINKSSFIDFLLYCLNSRTAQVSLLTITINKRNEKCLVSCKPGLKPG
jgi:hypothetical protein